MAERRLTSYAFTLTCVRENGSVTCPYGYFEARVIRYNVDMDYALIQSTVKKDLIPIPLSIGPVESDTDLKVFHVPIDNFNDTVVDDTLSVFTAWVKSTLPSKHHMKCSGGLYAGSSGAPFVLRNGKAIGFHCESSDSKGEVDITSKTNEEAIEILSETVNSHAHCYGSFCRALLIGSCKKLIQALTEFGVSLHDA
jgi:hypothetical protein